MNKNRLRRYTVSVSLALALATAFGCAATPTTESTGEFIDDAAITAKVKAEILNRPTLKMLDIHVQTDKGVVRLSGTVASQSKVDEAGKVARSVAGVSSVRNDLRHM